MLAVILPEQIMALSLCRNWALMRNCPSFRPHLLNPKIPRHLLKESMVQVCLVHRGLQGRQVLQGRREGQESQVAADFVLSETAVRLSWFA